MSLMVREPESTFTPAPAGTHRAVCCDVVDLGDVTTQYGTKPTCRIVWQIAELMPATGRPYTVSQRYTKSLHEKSKLRPALESWRGRKFSEEELQGFDLEKLIGANALLNIVQNVTDGKVYANVVAIIPPAKGLPKLAIGADYVRVQDREPRAPATHVSSDELPDREPGDDDESGPSATYPDIPFGFVSLLVGIMSLGILA
jgi:hypothetical protein